jgi:SAM-dependent methyltransferase
VSIDKSLESVDATKARVTNEKLTDAVDVRVGDATTLEFPDETFDFVVAVQVYSFVPNVARAMEEAARVLRKGGRLLVLESDWDMCIWKSRDPVFTRRMISARAETQFAHAHLPRDLHKLFRAAGLTAGDVHTFSIVETRYDPSSYGASVIGIPVTQLSNTACLLPMLLLGKKISVRVRRKVNGSFAWTVLCSRVQSSSYLMK